MRRVKDVRSIVVRRKNGKLKIMKICAKSRIIMLKIIYQNRDSRYGQIMAKDVNSDK